MMMSGVQQFEADPGVARERHWHPVAMLSFDDRGMYESMSG